MVVTLASHPATPLSPIDVVNPPAFLGTHTRSEMVNHADITHATLTDGKSVQVLAVDLTDDLKTAERVLIADTATADGRWVDPSELEGGYTNRTPYPLIDEGLKGMVSRANPYLLWAAFLIFPITYLITSYRWDLLLSVLDIRMKLSRAFVLNMVGSFYNTFMPGSTGGDLLKAYYASKLTPHRMRAVMSVLVDRVIGLLALVLLGGVSAATQWQVPKCRQVAMASAGIFAVTGIGLAVLYVPIIRRLTGFDFLVAKLPMQRHIRTALETMDMYRRRWGIALWSLVVSIPVHGTVVASAMLCGLAFGILKDHPMYYWAAVPVIVLSGSIPISPQGVGVMEGFAVLLLRPEGGTIAQAFALTMCIRILSILWNLSGGIFVLRGGFHAPTDAEQHSMGDDDFPETRMIGTPVAPVP